MKKEIVAAMLALAWFGVANAQTTNNTSTSGSTASANTSASNAGNAQQITFNSAATPRTQRIETTPSLGGNSFYGSYSPDSCAVSGGGGAGWTGFIFNLAGPIEQKSCVLFRAFERSQQAAATVASMDPVTAARLRQASIDMLCQVSDQVREALSYQGLCSNFDNKYNIAPPPPILASTNISRTVHQRINPDGTLTTIQ